MIYSVLLFSLLSLTLGEHLSEQSNMDIVTENYNTRIQYQPPRKPILLIPGIGGSILYADTPEYNGRVWVVMTNAESLGEYLVGFNHKIYTKYNDNGLSSIYNLDPDLIWRSDEANYFKDIIDNLVKIGYVSGIDLFGHPYDWRRSIKDISSEERLDYLIKKYNPIIISHSMGGLIIEDYIRKNGDQNIHSWISIVTPFTGAAGNILKSFINGYNLGNPFISNSLAKRIAENSYSAYDLLPNQMSLQPTITIDNVEKNWLDFFKNLNTFKSERFNLRLDIKLNKPLYCITNSAIATPFDYIKNGDNEQFTAVQGDGTVPYISLKNKYCTEKNLNDPNLSHVSMLRSFDLIAKLFVYSDNNCLLDGEYVNGVDIIRIYNNKASLNGIILDEFSHYLSCTEIKYDNKIYNRNIGTQCQRYSVDTEITHDGAKIRRCIYGNYYDYVVICDKNQQYNIEAEKCLLVEVNLVFRISLAILLPLAAVIILFFIYIFYKFVIKKKDRQNMVKLSEVELTEVDEIDEQV